MSLYKEASIILTPNAYKEGKLYSIKPGDGAGDMNVVRATTATRVNAEGLIEEVPYNLLTYSEQFNDASWTKFGVSVSVNTTTAPDGTLTADSIVENSASATQHRMAKFAISLTSGNTYTISAFVKRGVGSRNVQFGGSGTTSWIRVYFDLTNGTVGSQVIGTGTIENVGDDWYRITATGVSDLTGNNTFFLANTNGTTIGSETYNGDGTSSIIWWGAQLVQGTEAKEYLRTETRLNIPRLDYTNGSCPSILVEPQRTNLFLRSEEFDNAVWSKSNVTVTANQSVSPKGDLTMDLIQANASLSVEKSITQAGIATTAVNRTISFFVKNVDANFIKIKNSGDTQGYVNFDINTGVVGLSGSKVTGEIIDYGNNIYRIIAVFDSSMFYGATYFITFQDNVNAGFSTTTSNLGGFYVWGAQVEIGSNATSYIPTVASAVTRNADVISKTGIADLIGQSEGTLFFYGKINSSSGTRNITISDGTGSNRIILSFGNNGVNRVDAELILSGVGQASGLNNTLTITNDFKLAFTYDLNSFKLFINGVKIAEDLSGSTFSVTTLNQLHFGNFNGTSQFMDSFIKNLQLYKTAISEGEAITLTTL